MNLYLFNANDTAAIYGIGTYLRELTYALIDTAINIHIVHLHSVHSEFEIIKTDQVENWYIPEVRNDNTFSGPAQKVEGYLWYVIDLLCLHIKDTRDLVFHFNYNLHQLLARELKAIFNCKTVHTVHFLRWTLEFQGNIYRLHALKAKPEDQMTRYEKSTYATYKYESQLLKEVDRLIVLSNNMNNLLCSEYQINPKKISIIPNGLNDISKPVHDSNALRKKWLPSDKEFVILFAGRLHPVKGLQFLITAFRKVLETIPNCRLMVAGNGNDEMYLKESVDISTKVTFTGLLDKKELCELYLIADIGVIPSLYESFGFVAVEMMMHSLSIVATATSGLNEVVEDGITGLQIPVIEYPDKVEIDSVQLAEKMLFLLQHPDERKRMGTNARKLYETVYSAEIFRQNMLDFYRSLNPEQK